ncbi:MAG: carboxypeptidase-like regulatory domain-containing protein [Flavobacteriaceae bacterium]
MRHILIALLFAPLAMAQSDYRTWLRGKILYQNTNVVAANVVNTTTQKATISDDNGEFAIEVKMDDELVFTSLQYQIRVVKITKEILQRGRLVIDVNEKVTELDEVVVTPEQRQKFLDLRAEEFKEFDYERDRSTRVENTLMRQGQLYNGLNFVNVFKALYRLVDKGKSDEKVYSLQPSEVIRQLYDDTFFTEQLNIEKDKIGLFLVFCDGEIKTKELLEEKSDFEIMDFLVKAGEKFNRKN